MRLANYEFAETLDKKEWLNSVQMKVGLSYFGGKSKIGKYIFNNIFNLSVEMKKKGRKPDIFIDAFTGGGKMGLSVPYGWYDTIVMNDLNYGVYSFYKCCQDDVKYIALIYMIEKMGEIMSRDLFYLAAYLRNFGLYVDKWGNGKDLVKENEVVDELTAAAMTYWVTAAAFNAQTAPDSTRYNFTRQVNEKGEFDESKIEDTEREQREIERAIKSAYKRIPKIHEQLSTQNYIIENLDYRELIKKYNGKEWHDIQWKTKKDYKKILQVEGNYEESTFDEDYEKFSKEHTHINKEYEGKNILWYFDPPYHPYCLHGGKDAPYADSFTVELADEMTKILHGDKEDEYGKIEFFIKSDYDPVEAIERAKTAIKENSDESQKNWYKGLLAMEAGENEKKPSLTLSDTYKNMKWYKGMISSTFESLEKYPFCKVCVGGFDKGAVNSEHKKSIGQEYIWCRGFSEGYELIEGESAQ